MLDRIEIRALPPSKRTSAQGDTRDCTQNLATFSLGTARGQLCSKASAYDVGRSRITGPIACVSVGAAMFAPAACYSTFIAHIACSGPATALLRTVRASEPAATQQQA